MNLDIGGFLYSSQFLTQLAGFITSLLSALFAIFFEGLLFPSS